jgi:hypothetical protein
MTMRNIHRLALIAALALPLPLLVGQNRRWSEARANAWYENQPWLVGANYIPAHRH